jgi:hypothetical protein
MILLTLYAAWASSLDLYRQEGLSDEAVANERFFMAGTELVLVVRDVPGVSASFRYQGPQGMGFGIDEGTVAVEEALVGSVGTGVLHVWAWEESPMGVPPHGIVFLERWHLDSISGGSYTNLSPIDLVASDAAGGVGARTLFFTDDRVYLSDGRLMCLLDGGLVRVCAEGEAPPTPDQLTEHFRRALAGREGLHLPGVDPATLPTPRVAGPDVNP